MKNLFKSFLFIAAAGLLGSCVKDQDLLEDIKEGATNSVGFAAGISAPVTLDVVADTPFLVIPISAFYSGEGGADNDVAVSIMVDNSIIDEYNTTYGGALSPVPASSIVSTPTSLTIPSGSNQGQANVVINLDDMLQYGTNFAIGAELTSASGAPVSNSRSKQVYVISVRNQYDGLYNSVGTFTHPVPDYSGPFERTWTMVTEGADAVEFQLLAVVDFSVFITATVNPDNTLTYETAQVVLDPYDPALNYYDPAARAFHMDFTYSLGTRQCQTVATYIGPR